MKYLYGQPRRAKRVSLRVNATGRGRKIVISRSHRQIQAQIFDAVTGKTLLTVVSKKIKSDQKMTKTQAAFAVGETLAREALKKGIKKVIFDRRGYKYHGRVKSLAKGARSGGLDF